MNARPATATDSTRPLRAADADPPRWLSPKDPRKPQCEHDWSGRWGVEGEQQHRCKFCLRWVWDHDWPEPQLRNAALAFQARAEAAEARVAQLEAAAEAVVASNEAMYRHVEVPGLDQKHPAFCRGCGEDWPCPTVRARALLASQPLPEVMP